MPDEVIHRLSDLTRVQVFAQDTQRSERPAQQRALSGLPGCVSIDSLAHSDFRVTRGLLKTL